jgi:hypothetical protein
MSKRSVCRFIFLAVLVCCLPGTGWGADVQPSANPGIAAAMDAKDPFAEKARTAGNPGAVVKKAALSDTCSRTKTEMDRIRT